MQFEIALYRVENTVDELCGLKRRKSPCYLQSFVDDDGSWSIRFEKEFVDGQAKDVAVDHRHARYTPVFGSALDKIVYLAKMRYGAHYEIVGEFSSISGNIVAQLVPVEASKLVVRRPCDIKLKEHL